MGTRLLSNVPGDEWFGLDVFHIVKQSVVSIASAALPSSLLITVTVTAEFGVDFARLTVGASARSISPPI